MIRNLIIVLLLVTNLITFWLLWNLIDGYNPDCTGHHVEDSTSYRPSTYKFNI